MIFRRERLSSLRIIPYVGSKVTILTLLVIIQNVLLLGILASRLTFPNFDTPLLAAPVLEMFVTMVLISLAGTMLGLLISAFASTPDQAISIVPLTIIPQLLFAGLIFDIKPDTINEKLSWLMISRWGVDALGTSANLNQLCQIPNVVYEGVVQTQCAVTNQLQNDQVAKAQLFDRFPFINQGINPADIFPSAFEHSQAHRLTLWGVLGLFIIGGFVLTCLQLRRSEQ